uniref:Uncharacterized mitochondrial protein AtMg00810-like n=1 Tax=Nicotiana tabacum TaxID=4097 RepID=A0A1S4BEI4_TOBAC|nr:PREDICTED: uncharacterized mitochondrial protein AtMg00810-like [Nicotiana tabacum]
MLGCKPCATQIASGSKHSSLDDTPLSDHQAYQIIVGALQYITLTRLDLRYVVNHARHFMANPITAGCPTIHCSTTGFCIYFGDNLISSGSKKKPTVARASAEDEYKALATSASEI